MTLCIECCVDTIESAHAARSGGADRIELCADLADGGTTPSHGAITVICEQLDVPVVVLVRPRGGGFVYASDECMVMRRDVQHARALGARGVAVGALTANGDVDTFVLDTLREAARDMDVTFHRAFDVCRDPFRALETLMEHGVTRVLTSGQRATAWDGRELIAQLVRQAAGRIVIMAGGGVDETNAAELVSATGVTEIHVRGTREIDEQLVFHQHAVPFRKALPGDERVRRVTDAERVRAIRVAVAT
jgi:copper homeostasis protein